MTYPLTVAEKIAYYMINNNVDMDTAIAALHICPTSSDKLRATALLVRWGIEAS